MIFIVSMHRSGSSLLSGLFQEAGYALGAKDLLVESSEHNEKGYWERKDVTAVNEQLLTEGVFNSSFPDFYDPVKTNALSEQQFELVSQQLEAEGIQLIKDPRLCLTLPLWKARFPNARYLFLVRNPLQVAKSLQKRQKYPLNMGLALWEFYNRRALENLADEPFETVFFDELVESPREVTQRLSSVLSGERGSSETATTVSFSASLFDPSLIHNNDILDKDSGLSKPQQELYSALLDGHLESSQADSSEMMRTFDTVLELVEMGYFPNSGRMIDSNTRRLLDEKTNHLIAAADRRDKLESAIENWKSRYLTEHRVLQETHNELQEIHRKARNAKREVTEAHNLFLRLNNSKTFRIAASMATLKRRLIGEGDGDSLFESIKQRASAEREK